MSGDGATSGQRIDDLLAKAEGTIEGQATVLLSMTLALFFSDRKLTSAQAEALVHNATLCAAALVANRK